MKVVIIPTAKLIPIEMQSELGLIPPILIPLRNKPILSYLFEFYQKQKFHIIIAADEGFEKIQNFLRNTNSKNISIIKTKNSKSIGETVLQTLQKLKEKTKIESLVVHFGDTYVPTQDKNKLGKDFIYYSSSKDLYRWTTFLNEKQKINEISEKDQIKNPHLKWKTFIGIFGIEEFCLFEKIIKKTVRSKKNRVDPFYRALIEYYNLKNKTNFIQTKNWWDFGHIDTYFEIKKNLFLEKRSFNRISSNFLKNTITKTSRNEKKFKNEIKWYLGLPNELIHLVPRVYNYEFKKNKTSVELELYGYPTLSELYLFSEKDLGFWEHVFIKLEQVQLQLSEYKPKKFEFKKEKLSLRKMYVDKTKERLVKVAINRNFKDCHSLVNINGEAHYGIKNIMSDLEKSFNEIEKPKRKFRVIHGDFCLSNILFDQRTGSVKLIDPRGSFGGFSIYGDPFYEWAKLLHSLEGGYDLILGGFYKLQKNKKGYDFNLFFSEKQKKIYDLFYSRLRIKFSSKELGILRLIESLLFLSMIPLHSDDKEKQKALFLRGLQLYKMRKNQKLNL